MNKKELIEAVSEERDITKKEAEILVDTVFDVMINSIVDGEKVVISKFGTFKINVRKEREGISPKTQKKIVIHASKTVAFKPSNRLRDLMNQE